MGEKHSGSFEVADLLETIARNPAILLDPSSQLKDQVYHKEPMVDGDQHLLGVAE